MSQTASSDLNIDKRLSTLHLVGGFDVDGIHDTSVDLLVQGGALIKKKTVIKGNLQSNSFIFGTQRGDLIVDYIQEAELTEGVTFKKSVEVADPFKLNANLISEKIVSNLVKVDLIQSPVEGGIVKINCPSYEGTFDELMLEELNVNMLTSKFATFANANVDCLETRNITTQTLETNYLVANSLQSLYQGSLIDTQCVNANNFTSVVTFDATTLNANNISNISGDLLVIGDINISKYTGNFIGNTIDVDDATVSNIFVDNISPKTGSIIEIDGNIVSNSDSKFYIGTPSKKWKEVWTHDITITGNVVADELIIIMIGGNIQESNAICAFDRIDTDVIDPLDPMLPITFGNTISSVEDFFVKGNLIMNGEFKAEVLCVSNLFCGDTISTESLLIDVDGNLDLQYVWHDNTLTVDNLYVETELKTSKIDPKSAPYTTFSNNAKVDVLYTNVIEANVMCVTEFLANTIVSKTVDANVEFYGNLFIDGTLYTSNIVGNSPVTVNDIAIIQQGINTKADLNINENYILNVETVKTVKLDSPTKTLHFVQANIGNSKAIYIKGATSTTPSANINIDASGYIQGDLLITGNLQGFEKPSGVPSGSISTIMFGTVPTGWLECDGSTYSPLTYPTLFAVISNTYGGDGVSTFKVPDLRSRIGVGFSSGHPTFGSLGSSGGKETHKLTEPDLPSHTHTLSTLTSHYHTGTLAAQFMPPHVHGTLPGPNGSNTLPATYGPVIPVGPYGPIPTGYGAGGSGSQTTYFTQSHGHTHSLSFSSTPNHTHTLSSVGNDQPFSLLQPFLVVKYVIKI